MNYVHPVATASARHLAGNEAPAEYEQGFRLAARKARPAYLAGAGTTPAATTPAAASPTTLSMTASPTAATAA